MKNESLNNWHILRTKSATAGLMKTVPFKCTIFQCTLAIYPTVRRKLMEPFTGNTRYVADMRSILIQAKFARDTGPGPI